MRPLAAALALALLTLATAPSRVAAAYPDRVVRLIVAFPPAGTNDIIARLLAPRLSALWHQPVIVENRAGAGGTIGTDLVARAEPDGYTLLVTPPTPITISPKLYANLPYDPKTAFAPVTVVSMAPNILLVNAKTGAPSVAALVAAARAAPGKLTYASQGRGTTSHLSGALFATDAHLALVHIPYKGSGPAVSDLLAGRVDMMFDAIGNSLGHVRSGALRAIAVASAHRTAALPDVPTMAESGFPGFVSVVWYAVFAPAGTPDAVRATIAAAIGGILKDPEVVTRLDALGNEPAGSAPDAAAAFIRDETVRWTRVVQAAGITPE
ncbi:MAG TPA: tripartite tricarboxylate transporter substrate binding protein [Candidatus Sulfotelmatobacter sp.]|nr:tripartite tricarboxylate transporter substrate binding protein [Candidatus Sulfotelmatobacter sp.]